MFVDTCVTKGISIYIFHGEIYLYYLVFAHIGNIFTPFKFLTRTHTTQQRYYCPLSTSKKQDTYLLKTFNIFVLFHKQEMHNTCVLVDS